MKTKYFQLSIILLFGSFLLLNHSCDKVEEPFVELTHADTITHGGGDTNHVDVKKVLLEDYTGHKCPNCPEAAQVAKNLKAKYGDQLIVMSVHAGNFSTPDAEFPYDFRTPEGGTYNDFYQIYFYPAGLVNRTQPEGAASPVLFTGNWDGAIADILEQPQQATISITNDYNQATRELTTNIETEFLEDLEGTYYIIAYILESGIEQPQQSEAGVIDDYIHDHVLRGSMNGTWGGTVCTSGNAIAGVVFENEVSLTLDEEWDVDECEVVAVVYRFDSPLREIVQAEVAQIVNSK